MRIFGCPAYVHISSEDRSNFDLNSKKCIFLGFMKWVKGYKLWDLVAQTVMISRDVIFYEKYKVEENNNNSCRSATSN